jgi:HAD superfamily hydrolase (TIGR01509 family)
MKVYQAIFLDRDGTLCQNSVEKARERDRAIGEIIGRPEFSLTPEAHMEVFWRVRAQPGIRPVNTLAREKTFWIKWYQLILEDHGVKELSERLATDLYERFPFYKMMELYPETVEVLERLKTQGYKLGVISDTYPSLQASIESLGIADYFCSFTASSVVGASKPDPKIFRAATRSLELEPQDCVFVDDCRKEADGAREQGFTSFHLDRQRLRADFGMWTIGNLEHLLEFLSIE